MYGFSSLINCCRLNPRVRRVMSRIRPLNLSRASERRRFPVPLRWSHAGGDLSRRNHANQRADRPLIRSAPPPTPHCALPGPPSTPYPGRLTPTPRPPHNRRANQISIALAAARRPNLPATSCPGAFWTPAAGARGTSRDAGVQKPAQDRRSFAWHTPLMRDVAMTGGRQHTNWRRECPAQQG